jgi:hypothetical protein
VVPFDIGAKFVEAAKHAAQVMNLKWADVLTVDAESDARGQWHSGLRQLVAGVWQTLSSEVARLAGAEDTLFAYNPGVLARYPGGSEWLTTLQGQAYNELMVRNVRDFYHLTNRYQRLRSQGLLTFAEYAAAVGAHPQTVKIWRRNGLITGIAYNDKNGYLFAPPGPEAPHVSQGVPYTDRRPPGFEPKPIRKYRRRAV